MHTGSCLCGGVRFRIDADLEPIQVCHCSQCRKAQGTPFATNTPVSADAFHLISGEALLSAFESSPGKQRVFCSHCGSPIYSQKDTVPGVLRVRAGLLDEPPDALQARAAELFFRTQRLSFEQGRVLAADQQTLEEENAKLKRLLTGTMLDDAALNDLLSKKW